MLIALIGRCREDADDQQQRIMTAASARLNDNKQLCRRVAHHMEWLLLWHAPLPTTVATTRVEPECAAAVDDWLARQRRLVRCRALPHSAGAYASTPPAMVSDLWVDFVAASSGGVPRCDEQEFALLLADRLGERPRRHGWCRRAHFIGYVWRAETHQRTVLSVVDLAQRTRLPHTRLPDVAARRCRQHLLQHLRSRK